TAGGTSEVCSIAEIRGIDYKCVALPMAARITQPLADTRFQVWNAIQRDDASFMNHFVKNDHTVRTLHDLDITVIRSARNSRQRLRDETLPQTAIEPRVRAASGFKAACGAQRTAGQLFFSLAGACLRDQGRNLPIRRIDDQRRTMGLDDARGPIPPEIV